LGTSIEPRLSFSSRFRLDIDLGLKNLSFRRD